MPWTGLIATTPFAPEAHYRGPGRRAPKERPAKALAQEPPATPSEPFDPAYYAGRFKTDLSQLQAFDGAREAPGPSGGESDQQLFDFFGNLSVLLLAVRAGDIQLAQAAADALEMEVLVERSAGRPAPLLDELGARFGAAPSQDEGAARLAARELAADFQSAAEPAPDPEAAPPDDGGAAYETLTQYLGAGAL